MVSPHTGQIICETRSAAETQRLARMIGALAPPGLVLTIAGDLGSGKTCFVQGLARGLEVPQEVYVTSPSYTLVNSYDGRHPLHHVDLYRLGAADLDDIGLFDLMVAPAVVAIEWPERMADDLPSEHLAIHIQTIPPDTRRLTLAGYGLAPLNLIKALEKALKE